MASKLWWNSFMLYISTALVIVGVTIMGLSLTKYPRQMWNRVKPKTSLSGDGQVSVSGRMLSMTDGKDWRTRFMAYRSGKREPNEYDNLVKQSERLRRRRKSIFD